MRRSLPWAALALAVLFMARGGGPAGRFGVGQQAPALQARLTDGSAFDLRDARGQITVLNFWASYCGPCRAEAPMLNAARADDIRVVGLSVEVMPEAEVARRARTIGMLYPVGVAADEVVQTFDVQAVPTTYVIASDGVIVLSRVGAISERELTDALAAARRRAS